LPVLGGIPVAAAADGGSTVIHVPRWCMFDRSALLVAAIDIDQRFNYFRDQ
jgi:hypothetical protein